MSDFTRRKKKYVFDKRHEKKYMKTRTMFVSISQRMAWHSNGIQMFNRSVGKKNISKKQSMLVMIIFLSSYGGDSRKQIRTYELHM